MAVGVTVKHEVTFTNHGSVAYLVELTGRCEGPLSYSDGTTAWTPRPPRVVSGRAPGRPGKLLHDTAVLGIEHGQQGMTLTGDVIVKATKRPATGFGLAESMVDLCLQVPVAS